MEPIVFLYMTSFQLNLVTFPQLLLEHVCVRAYGNRTKCELMENGYFQSEYDEIQQQSAMWYSVCVGVLTTIVTFMLPTATAISDVFGKRKVLMAGPISLIFQNLLWISIVSHGLDFATWIVLLPVLPPAFAGSLSTVLAVSSAYIALITSDENRRVRITFIDAVYFMGIFIATISSGLIIERFGFIGTYVFNIVLQVLSVLYLVFFLKPVTKFQSSGSTNDNSLCDSFAVAYTVKDGLNLEDMPANEKSSTKPPGLSTNELHPLTNREYLVSGAQPKDNEEKEDLISVCEKEINTKEREGLVSVGGNENGQLTLPHESQKKMMRKLLLKRVSNPLANFKAMIVALKKLKQRKISFSLLVALCFCIIAQFGEQSIIIFYLKSPPFHMGAKNIGFFLAFKNALIAVVGHGLLNLILEKCFKINEARLLVFFVISGITFQILLGVTKSILMLCCIQIFNAIFNLSVPNIRSFISKMAEHDAVGTVMGGVIMVENFAVLIQSFIIPFTYAGLLSFSRGAAFFLLAAILSGTLVIAVFCAKHLKSDTQAKPIN